MLLGVGEFEFGFDDRRVLGHLGHLLLGIRHLLKDLIGIDLGGRGLDDLGVGRGFGLALLAGLAAAFVGVLDILLDGGVAATEDLAGFLDLLVIILRIPHLLGVLVLDLDVVCLEDLASGFGGGVDVTDEFLGEGGIQHVRNLSFSFFF